MDFSQVSEIYANLLAFASWTSHGVGWMVGGAVRCVFCGRRSTFAMQIYPKLAGFGRTPQCLVGVGQAGWWGGGVGGEWSLDGLELVMSGSCKRESPQTSKPGQSLRFPLIQSSGIPNRFKRYPPSFPYQKACSLCSQLPGFCGISQPHFKQPRQCKQFYFSR